MALRGVATGGATRTTSTTFNDGDTFRRGELLRLHATAWRWRCQVDQGVEEGVWQ
jgi:hypothetical protein